MTFNFSRDQDIKEVNVIKDRHSYKEEEVKRLRHDGNVKKWSELKDNYTKSEMVISFEAKKSFFDESRSSNAGLEQLSAKGNDTRVKQDVGKQIFGKVDWLLEKILGKD